VAVKRLELEAAAAAAVAVTVRTSVRCLREELFFVQNSPSCDAK